MAYSEFKAGAFSGVLAAVMIIALSVMALAALESPREAPTRVAAVEGPLR